MQTTIRVATSTRDAIARIAADHDETLGEALARLVREHDATDAVDRIEQWYADMPPDEQAITAALDAADRAEQAAA